MKKLIIISLSILSLNSFATELKEKDANELYSLNEKLFSDKEIRLSSSLCNMQNDLAKIAKKSLRDCVNRSEGNEESVSMQNAFDAIFLSSVLSAYSDTENQQQKEFDEILDKGINKLKK